MANDQLERANKQLDAALDALVQETLPAVNATQPAPTLPEAPPSGALPADPQTDAIRTLSRLLVGAVLLGLDQVELRAPDWERQAALKLADPSSAAVPPQQPIAQPPALPGPAGPPTPSAEAMLEARHALIGWLFATGDQLRLDPDPSHWVRAAGSHMFATTSALLGQSLGMFGIGRRATRPAPPNPEITRWIALGRAEEKRSRAVASVAMNDILNETIDFLAQNKSIQNLITTQSTGLADEVLEEVRERTVSADIYLDSLVRRIFRRAPATVVVTPPSVSDVTEP